MQRDSVAFSEHSRDERRCVLSDMGVDQKERRVYAFVGQRIEQRWRRRRVRPVVICQVDGRRRCAGHVPDAAAARHRVEDERRRQRVHEHRESARNGNGPPHLALPASMVAQPLCSLCPLWLNSLCSSCPLWPTSLCSSWPRSALTIDRPSISYGTSSTTHLPAAEECASA